MMTASKRNLYARWLPVAALLAAVSPYLMRQLWFDEALTVLEFSLLKSPADIYTSYVIPNNHILFTVVIHYWIKFQPSWLALDLWLRLPSLFCAIGLLLYMGRRFRRFCGALPLAVTLATLAISPPFLVYATAVRGYMMGALLVTIAMGSALDLCAAYRLRDLVIYELCVFGAVLTVPSDLAALVGVLLFVIPVLGRRFWLDWRFYLLTLAVPAAFLVAYLPIWSDFLAVSRLGEGWHERGSSVVCVYVALFSALGLMTFTAAWHGARNVRGRNWHRLLRWAIWLLPIPAAWIFKAAPFPRVYFPLFPVLAVAAAMGLRDVSLWDRKRTLKPRSGQQTVLIVALLTSFVSWSTLWRSPQVLSALSQRFGGDLGDDFFHAYYLRRGHRPELVAEALEKLDCKTVYLSFLSDPWAIRLYHMARGNHAVYLFDGPRGLVPELPPLTAVVLRRDEKPEILEQRFGRRLHPVTVKADDFNWRIFIAGEAL